MPLVSAGRFNGGTITNPLVIAPADGNAVPLILRASWAAQNVDFFAIVSTDNGVKLVQVDLNGELTVALHSDAVNQTHIAPGSITTFDAGGATGVSLARTFAGLYGHAPVAQPAAPTDAASIIAALQAIGIVAT